MAGNPEWLFAAEITRTLIRVDRGVENRIFDETRESDS
jgi:hypothetical protein